MRGSVFTRAKVKTLLQYVVLVFLVFLFVSLCFDSNLNFSPIFFSLFTKPKIQIEYQQNEEFLSDLRNAVSKSFSYYLDHCPSSGEVDSLTGECINNFGFPVTLLESLETLYLLGLKDLYNRAYSMVKSHFKCSELGFVNKRELWTRGVASLIGAYSLTGQDMFMKKATECAQLLIQNETNNQIFIEMTTGKTEKRKIESGVELSDISVGYPEAYAIYNYTRNELFLRYLKRKVQKLPKVKDGLVSMYSASGSDQKSTDNFSINHNTINFYHDIALIGEMHRTRQFLYLLNGIEEYISLDENSQNQYLMLEVERLRDVKFNKSSELYNHGLSEHNPPFTVFKQGHPDQLIPFTFDDSFLLTLYKKGKMDIITTIVMASLEQCKTRNGISGIGKSSKQRPFFTNIQHTSFFGEWTKFGVLSVIKNQRLENAIYNSHGHILYLPN